MNFEQWFSEKYGNYNLEEDSGWYARDGWETCRQEILKILKDYENTYIDPNGLQDRNGENLIDKIEKTI